MSSGTQCEAVTMADSRCQREPYSATHECRWYGLAELLPSAGSRCGQHLPGSEKDARREATEGRPDSWSAARWRVLPEVPACWSWPVPEDLDATDPWGALVAWQADRCALCGKGGRYLVTDHCHESGLKRGLLCWGCNVHEGQCPKSPCGCDGYRARSPAVMLGVRVAY